MAYQPPVGECLSNFCTAYEDAHQETCMKLGSFFADENAEDIFSNCLKTDGCVLRQTVSVEIQNA